ncbi:MAG: hypothetical protein ACK4RK_07820 [Gemmataceae bacterium]
MLKKLAFTAVGLVALLLVFSMTNLGSYTGSMMSKLWQKANDQVPIPVKIDRMRHEIAKLDTDVEKHSGAIANALTEIELLEREIARMEKSLADQEHKIVTLTNDLRNTQSPQLVYAGKTYTVEQVRRIRDRDFHAFRTAEENLNLMKRQHELKKEAVEAAKAHVWNIKNTKAELEVALAELQKEYDELQMEKDASKLVINDRRLTDIEAGLQDIRNQLSKERHKRDVMAEFQKGEIPLNVESATTPPAQKDEAVLDYFSRR